MPTFNQNCKNNQFQGQNFIDFAQVFSKTGLKIYDFDRQYKKMPHDLSNLFLANSFKKGQLSTLQSSHSCALGCDTYAVQAVHSAQCFTTKGCDTASLLAEMMIEILLTHWQIDYGNSQKLVSPILSLFLSFSLSLLHLSFFLPCECMHLMFFYDYMVLTFDRKEMSKTRVTFSSRGTKFLTTEQFN